MRYQDNYVVRTISDLVRVTTRPVLGRNDIDHELSGDKEKYTPLDRVYRRLKDLADVGDINEAESFLSDQLDPSGLDCLEMTLAFCMYLNQSNDDIPYQTNHSREEIVDDINSVRTEYDISGFEHLVDTTTVQKEGAHGDKEGAHPAFRGVL